VKVESPAVKVDGRLSIDNTFTSLAEVEGQLGSFFEVRRTTPTLHGPP
jgi:hypothetical protein